MDLLEYYHNTGKCPDRYYYQLNGKDAGTNYAEIQRRRAEDTRKLLEDRHLEQLIEKQV
jgi:hypothetical protein